MNAPANITPPSIVAALAKALPELESAKKNKANPAFKSKYADIAAVIEAIQPIANHGLWFRQVSHEREGGACIETIYIHESGQELSAGIMFIPASKKDAQGFGSAETYARRYGLQTAFGLATEDDDGNAAVKATKPATIDDAAWAELVQLVEVTKTDVQKLCGAYKVGSLKELTAEQATAAKGILTARLAKMAKETEDA